MIPHESHNQRPDPEPPLNILDFIIVALMTIGIYISLVTVSIFNLFMCLLAWRMYERYRTDVD